LSKIEIRSRYWDDNSMHIPHWECRILGQPKLKFIPRKGDLVTIQADNWKVDEVEYDIDENVIFIYVVLTETEARIVTVPKEFMSEEERIHFETCGK